MKRWSTEDFYGDKAIRCDTVMVDDTCLSTLSKSIECTPPGVHLNVNCG